MRLAVFSDIHGSLLALETVLEDIRAAGGVDLMWCLGDLAAFGPRPAECIRRIKALSEENEGKTFKVIGGNTDRYMVTGERLRTPPAKDDDSFRKLAKGWQERDSGLNWGVEQIGFEEYEFVQKLVGRELGKEVEGFGYVIGYHAAPGSDEAFLLPDTPAEEALDLLLDREGRLAIGGHTHVQMNRRLGHWHVVNVGSVGMSFDNPGFAQWGLFTFENGQADINLRHVPYNLEAVIADLHAVGYPAPEWTASRMRGKR